MKKIVTIALVLALTGLTGGLALAAPWEISEGDYAEMTPNQRGHLLDCQLEELNKQVPKKEAHEFTTDYAVQAMGREGGAPTPLQIQLMREYGISCTQEEIVPKPIAMDEVAALSDEEAEALGRCQMDKFVARTGKERADRWAFRELENGLGARLSETPEVVEPYQHKLIRTKGISCTEEEMWRHVR